LSWLKQQQGTFIVEYVIGQTVKKACDFEVREGGPGGSTTTRINGFGVWTGAADRNQITLGASAIVDSTAPGASTTGERVKVAFTWREGYQAVVRKGSTSGSKTAEAFGSLNVLALAQMNIGWTDNGQYGLGIGNQIGGWVKSVKYYPFALPAAALAALTN
jgi:hypothetical protein